MKKYIATIAITAVSEVVIVLSPEEQEEYDKLSYEDQGYYIIDKIGTRKIREEMNDDDGHEFVDLQES